jgi:predicted P-loop ATPase
VAPGARRDAGSLDNNDGAAPDDWTHFDLVLGLGVDLVPVAHDIDAPIVPRSKLKAQNLGKAVTEYGADGKVRGVAQWTKMRAKPAQLNHWGGDRRLSIGIQCRAVRALDIDIDDPELAAEVAVFIEEHIPGLPKRTRSNSAKFLQPFLLEGDWKKRRIKTKCSGAIEFLADGQMFVAAGRHKSGVRYEWDGGLPNEIPAVAAEQFEALWDELEEMFGVGPKGQRPRAVWRAGNGRVRTEINDDQLCDLRSALSWPGLLDDAANNAVWSEAGYALLSLGDVGFELWSEFCAAAPNGEDGDAETWWNSHVHADVRSDFRHIFNMASERGWKNPGLSMPAAIDDFEDLDAGMNAITVKIGHDLMSKLTTQKNGYFWPQLANIMAAFRAGASTVSVRHDSFRDELMWAPSGTEEWRPLDDNDVTAFQEAFERARFRPIGRDTMRNALHKLGAENAFDSAEHWLTALEWDGVPRIERFLTEYFGAADSPYAQAVSKYLWTAMAARVLEPGCQADMVPILVGGQGLRKTRGLEAMVPAPEHFTGFGFHRIDHPDTCRRMRGVLLGEIAELKGLNTRDVESIKDWVTRTHERWTPKYKEFDSVFPRRLVFVGTTNEEEFLADETGNRRWLPIRVGQANTSAIAEHREHLWAEARDRFRASGIAWQDAEKLAPAEHADFETSDSWEEAISDWLDGPDINEVWDEGDKSKEPARRMRPFRTIEVIRGALGLHCPGMSTKAHEMRVGKILRKLGCRKERVSIDGEQVRAWVAPNDDGGQTT